MSSVVLTRAAEAGRQAGRRAVYKPWIRQKMGRKRLRETTGGSVASTSAAAATSNKRRARDESSGSEDDGSDEDGLRLDVQHDSIEVTFEFNDMREENAEGITTLLRWFLPSHEAYEMASVICKQGNT
jgi:hypothetical protein